MNYIVTCSDGLGPYGPFRDEGEAYRYAGMLDVDPACPDTNHGVDYGPQLIEPLPFDEMRAAVRTRIERELRKVDA